MMRLAYILGIASVLSQVVLLRECVVAFYGNEMAYAALLGSWLFWIAAGSFITSLVIAKLHNPKKILSTLYVLSGILLPVTVIAVRLVRVFLGIHIGEAIDIFEMCGISFLILAPATAILGSIFTLICHLFSLRADVKASAAVSKVYFWESKGATAGGVAFSFLLVFIMPTLYCAFLISAVHFIALFFLERRNRTVVIAIGTLFVIGCAVCCSGGFQHLDAATRSMQWKGFEVVSVTDSRYGNIALVKRDQQYSLFENGLLSYSTHDPLTVEENMHYALLEHPDPKRVLLIGGGIIGGVEEILKYDIDALDYVELDPAIIDMARAYIPKALVYSSENNRVKTIYADARWFVRQTHNTYDVVIINLSDPHTAMTNRYYTHEFFSELKKILLPQGVISLSVTSSENYIGTEAAMFLRSINSTLRSVFSDVLSIPGDTNIFLGCVSRGVLTDDVKILARRLKQRAVRTEYVQEYYLSSKMSRDRLEYINEILRTEGIINTDMRPIAYLYDNILFSTRFNAGLKNITKALYSLRPIHLMLVPCIVLVLGYMRARTQPLLPVTLSIATTGFSEIIFQVVVIMAFQTLYGFAYYKISLIIASFMGGLVLGSFIARKLLEETTVDIKRFYQAIQASICLYPLMLPGLFIIFRNGTTLENIGIFATLFALLPVVAGCIGGMQYPLATHLVHGEKGRRKIAIAEYAGGLYALDALGAAVGAFVAATFLIPLFGIDFLAFFCAMLNIAVLILLMRFSYPAK